MLYVCIYVPDGFKGLCGGPNLLVAPRSCTVYCSITEEFSLRIKRRDVQDVLKNHGWRPGEEATTSFKQWLLPKRLARMLLLYQKCKHFNIKRIAWNITEGQLDNIVSLPAHGYSRMMSPPAPIWSLKLIKLAVQYRIRTLDKFCFPFPDAFYVLWTRQMREINPKDLGNLVWQVIITTTNPLITGRAEYQCTGSYPCFGRNCLCIKTDSSPKAF